MLNDFLAEFAPLLIQGTVDTLVMVFASTAVAYVIGTVLGVILHLSLIHICKFTFSFVDSTPSSLSFKRLSI